ncbi:MAG: hypothetical protein KF729_15390 [Sandaracinaceae bacterium]|nr:hypothetical protein [Sandaracinaceae bacterium]
MKSYAGECRREGEMMGTRISVALGTTVALLGAAEVEAQQPVNGTSGADVVFIGYLDATEAGRAGGPGTGRGVYACVFNPSTDVSSWQQLESNTATLSQSYKFNALGGNDEVEIINANVAIGDLDGDTSGGQPPDCGGRTWAPLNYSSYYFDLDGDAGQDGLWTAYGYSFAHGDDSGATGYDDYVMSGSWNASSRHRGFAGDDALIAAGTVYNRDRMYGDDDDDCVLEVGTAAAYAEGGDHDGGDVLRYDATLPVTYGGFETVTSGVTTCPGGYFILSPEPSAFWGS